MNYYLDFEATQQGEIISIGIVSEDDKTFYSLVKPAQTEITPYITDITGITEQELQEAPNIDKTLLEMWCWLGRDGFVNNNFYAYGADAKFIEKTLASCKSDIGYMIATALKQKLQDCTREVWKFFRGSLKLNLAYEYITQTPHEQNHNALDDAIMCRDVYIYATTHEPLESHPYKTKEYLKQIRENKNTFTPPQGKFFCVGKNSGYEELEFEDINAAIDYIVNRFVVEKDRENVNRARMMGRIMKAVKKKNTYQQMNWRREK